MKTVTKEMLEMCPSNTQIKALLKGKQYTIKEICFGLSTSKKALAEKAAFLAEKTDDFTLRVHRYSESVRSKNSYRYNRIYAREYTFKAINRADNSIC